LPVVLAIHNVDEYMRFDDFVKAFHGRLGPRILNRQVVFSAATLLTLAVAVLCALTFIYRTPVLYFVSQAAIFAILLNAIGHCVLSVKRRSRTPGTVSAICFVIPYCSWAVLLMTTGLGQSRREILLAALLGAAGMAPVIYLFLMLGLIFARIVPRVRRGNEPQGQRHPRLSRDT
jgi:hypothetical protein